MLMAPSTMANAFSCAECSTVKKNQNELRSHICACHLENWKAFGCDFCGETAHTAEEMRCHLRAEHDIATGDYFTHQADSRRQGTLELILALSLHQPDDDDDDEAESGDDEGITDAKSESEAGDTQAEQPDPPVTCEKSVGDGSPPIQNPTDMDSFVQDQRPSAPQLGQKECAAADDVLDAPLEPRKVLPGGRRQPTRQMLLRDVSYCVDCDSPVTGGNAARHVYSRHMTDHHPFVCRLCGKGGREPFYMKRHFGREHPREQLSFDDRRDEIEQDFLMAFFSCFELKHDATQYAPDLTDEFEAPDIDGMDRGRSLRSQTRGISTSGSSDAAPQTAEADVYLEPRKKSQTGQRVPTWQMKQRDSTFCLECDQPVSSTRASHHIYMEHLSGYPYVCRLCGEGRYEATKMRSHMDQHHTGEESQFDDRRDQLEQDFLRAYLTCYALRPDIDSPVEVEHAVTQKLEASADTPQTSRKRKVSEAEDSSPIEAAKKRIVAEEPQPEPEVEATPEALVKPVLHELDDTVPKRALTWQMRQRDSSYCQLCESAPLKSHKHVHIEEVHLSRKPFACSVCGHSSSLVSSVKTHAKNVHKGESAQILDYRASLQEEYGQWHARCFRVRNERQANITHSSLIVPDDEDSANCAVNSTETLSDSALSELMESEGGTPSSVEARVRLKPTWRMNQRDCSHCIICDTPVGKNSGSARFHIYNRHISDPPFTCSVCGKHFKKRSVSKGHLRNVHKLEGGCIRDNRGQLEEQYEVWHERCFAKKKNL